MKDKSSDRPGPMRANDLSGKAHKLDTMGMVAGGIVHDFNNLLTTISGYAEMISDELPEGSALSEKVMSLRSAVTRASLLSQHLLNIGDNYPDKRSKVCLNEILLESISLFRNLNASEITIESDIPAESIFVFADQNQLFRIFLNLLLNAIQSMDEKKGGLLFISAALILSEKAISPARRKVFTQPYALVTVRDTGKGMDRKTIKRIFDPQFSGRSDSPVHGFGLSVVNDIVQDIEGDIKVTSKTGVGTVFRIYLPSIQ